MNLRQFLDALLGSWVVSVLPPTAEDRARRILPDVRIAVQGPDLDLLEAHPQTLSNEEFLALQEEPRNRIHAAMDKCLSQMVPYTDAGIEMISNAIHEALR